MSYSMNWAFLHGQPQCNADFKSQPEHFKVTEILPFEPSGEGEHVFIQIEKRDENTAFIARQIAKQLNVAEKFVSYAGLKDRFAVTKQWFSVHIPGKVTPDISTLQFENAKVLQLLRHDKKLKTGALAANHFEIKLENVSDIAELKSRWHMITQQGVPNYYGEQRFGIEQSNINNALQMFAGHKVKNRTKRGLYLSAARSWLFNLQVSKRIELGLFAKISAGDVCMLAGSQSVFLCEQPDDSLQQRLADFDIDLTASLWGKGALMSQNEIAVLEQQIADEHCQLATGLVKNGLTQERKRIRLQLIEPELNIQNQTAILQFKLAKGCYATSVLRELVQYQDKSQLQREIR